MANITEVPAEIRALTSHGAVVVPGTAGATVSIGDVVYQAADGDWEEADANVVGLQTALGVAVQSYDGESTVAAGNALSVCMMGPVSGYTDITPGALYYLSNDVGKIADAEGAYDRILGVGVELAGQDVLWLNIQLTDAASD
jgi:hypothetical protein